MFRFLSFATGLWCDLPERNAGGDVSTDSPNHYRPESVQKSQGSRYGMVLPVEWSVFPRQRFPNSSGGGQWIRRGGGILLPSPLFAAAVRKKRATKIWMTEQVTGFNHANDDIMWRLPRRQEKIVTLHTKAFCLNSKVSQRYAVIHTIPSLRVSLNHDDTGTAVLQTPYSSGKSRIGSPQSSARGRGHVHYDHNLSKHSMADRCGTSFSIGTAVDRGFYRRLGMVFGLVRCVTCGRGRKSITTTNWICSCFRTVVGYCITTGIPPSVCRHCVFIRLLEQTTVCMEWQASHYSG